MQRFALMFGVLILLCGVLLAVVSPDASIMLLAAICSIGAIVALPAAVVRTLHWAAGTSEHGRRSSSGS